MPNSPHQVVVDFSAVWCGPCQMIGPFFGQLSETYDGQLVFVKVDVDANSVSAPKAFLARCTGALIPLINTSNA